MNQLVSMQALVRVVDAGSFSAAARQWGRSKAAVSKYVSDLEEHLRVALLHRTTRSLSLTDAGRAYHNRCVEILHEIDALESSLHQDRLSPRGTLRITAPPGFASRYLALMTTDFVSRYPEITVDLDLTHRMVDLVEEGIDVAIRVTVPPDSTLVARQLAPVPIVAVAAPEYLARNGTPTTPRDLRDHACLVDTNHRDQHRWRFHTAGRDQTVAVRGPFRINNPEAILSLAIAGHGVALLPAFIVAPAIQAGDLVEVVPGTVRFEWYIYAIYPRRRHLPSRVRAFVDHMVAAFAAAPIP